MPERKRRDALETEHDQTETEAGAGAGAGLVELQQGAGNRAVSRMIGGDGPGGESPFDQGALIGRIGHAAPASTHAGTGKIQRKDGPDGETSTDTTEDTVEETPEVTSGQPSPPDRQATYAGSVSGMMGEGSGVTAPVSTHTLVVSSIPLPTPTPSGTTSDPGMAMAASLVASSGSLLTWAVTVQAEVHTVLEGVGGVVPGPELAALLRRVHATAGLARTAAEKGMSAMSIVSSPLRSQINQLGIATQLLQSELLVLLTEAINVQANLQIQAGMVDQPQSPTVVDESSGQLSSQALAIEAMLAQLVW